MSFEKQFAQCVILAYYSFIGWRSANRTPRRNSINNITAVKAQNDGRQWFNVTFAEDEFGQEAGTHEFAVTVDGALLNSDGARVDYNDYLRSAVLRAVSE